MAATPLNCSAPSDVVLLPLPSLKILRFCQFFQQIIAISLRHCGPSSSCQKSRQCVRYCCNTSSPHGRQSRLLRREPGSDPFLPHPSLRSHSCCFAFSLLPASAGGLACTVSLTFLLRRFRLLTSESSPATLPNCLRHSWPPQS